MYTSRHVYTCSIDFNLFIGLKKIGIDHFQLKYIQPHASSTNPSAFNYCCIMSLNKRQL